MKPSDRCIKNDRYAKSMLSTHIIIKLRILIVKAIYHIMMIFIVDKHSKANNCLFGTQKLVRPQLNLSAHSDL